MSRGQFEKKKKKKNVKMLGFWGSHDFEEIHFCFIIYYFCFIGNFLEYIYIYLFAFGGTIGQGMG